MNGCYNMANRDATHQRQPYDKKHNASSVDEKQNTENKIEQASCVWIPVYTNKTSEMKSSMHAA